MFVRNLLISLKSITERFMYEKESADCGIDC